MLKLEELSRLNWVQYKGKPEKILRFDGGFVALYLESVPYGDLEPLPITPETLAMLGFVRTNMLHCGDVIRGAFAYCNDYNVVVVYWKDNFVTHNGFIFQEIHRLQNYIQAVYGITLTPTKP